MERQPQISADVLARYAADAALEVDGVTAMAEGALHRGHGVIVSGEERALEVSLSIKLGWGQSAREVGEAVQQRVAEYLDRMAGSRPASVDVVVETVGAPPPTR